MNTLKERWPPVCPLKKAYFLVLMLAIAGLAALPGLLVGCRGAAGSIRAGVHEFSANRVAVPGV